MEIPKTAFWAEMAASEHLTEIFESDATFINHLTDYVADGLAKGQAVILIITPAHLSSLEARLMALAWDLDRVRSHGQLLSLDAEESLKAFMFRGWPDEDLFRSWVRALLKRATRDGRKARAFGEAVALLWSQGHSAATLRLEKLWDESCLEHEFPIYCAYPKPVFGEHPADSMQRIRQLHSIHFD